jgi:hypothetical protein
MTVPSKQSTAGSTVETSASPTLASLRVDPHVHAYDIFDHGLLLDTAAKNFRRAGAVAGLLCLTETSRDHAFRRWREEGRVGDWRVYETDDTALLRLEHDRSLPMWALAGRQIITADRLEVHALGVDAEFADGRDTVDTIAEVRGAGALAVLPYGVGKWTGSRGRLVSQLIERYADGGIVLGDNSGRITLGPRCPQFDQAAAHRLTLLPGTDPLPMRGMEKRVATLGVVLDGPFADYDFAGQIKRKLAGLGPVPHRFGRHLSPLGAMLQQIGLRIGRNRSSGASGRAGP